MIVEMKESALVDVSGRFGTRFDARIMAHGVLVDLPAIRTSAGTTILRPVHAQNGRTVRRDSKVYRAAVACLKAALVAVDA